MWGGVFTTLKPFQNSFTSMDFLAVYPFRVQSTQIKGPGVGPALTAVIKPDTSQSLRFPSFLALLIWA